MTIKDSFEVAGMPCTSGAPDLAQHVPATNATAVQRPIDAGAIVFGKANLPLYAGDFQRTRASGSGSTTRPVDAALQHRASIQLLNGVMSAGFPPEIIAGAEAAAMALPASDDSFTANAVRGVALRHRECVVVNEHRTRLRAQWAGFFREIT